MSDKAPKENYVTKYRLSMVAEEHVPYPLSTQSVKSPEGAAQLLWSILGDSPREQALVLFCNVKRHVTGYTILTTGSKGASIVKVGEVFTAAVYADAHSIIFGHNHPSGEVAPSAQDRSITARLRQAGTLMDIELTDHIIVASGVQGLRYYSFAQEGW